jgi:hypothetical protein
MSGHAFARLVGGVLLAFFIGWSQMSLAVCGWGDDELPFLFSVGGWNYSIDSSGQYHLQATSITYSYGTTPWINMCNASGNPGSADAVAGANKAAYLSLRAYRSPIDPSDNGIEVARSETLLLHVWNPAPAVSPPSAGVWVGYGGSYTSPAITPLKTLPDGTYTLTMYLAEASDNVAWYFHDFPQPLVVGSGSTTSTPNYEGLWWAAPAGSESGWGINFAHQGDVIFVTWFTYDTTGKAWWLTMTASKTADNVYTGALIQTHGPPFNAVPFNPMSVTRANVGSGTLTFTDINNGTFMYTVNGVTQTKTIARQVFGPVPTCVWGAQQSPTTATNYQDLWYASPAESESGWGVNFTHQGDSIFATWFTYDFDGTPLWLSATLAKTAPGIYMGGLVRTTGPAFNAVPFNPAIVMRANVGTLTVTFANGNSASYAYTVSLPGQVSVTQSKQITRQVFSPPGTLCL